MSVATVNGTVGRGELGIVLPHEHIFINLTNQFTEPADPDKRRLSRRRITLRDYGALRRNPYAIRDNLIMDDLDLAVEETGRFKQAGGGTIVDCTSVGLNRSPQLLRCVAERTGLNIVAGCGYYTYDTHPSDMDARSAESLADEMARDLTQGIEETGVRAGVIGELGTSEPLRPNEEKLLRAAARAHGLTGAPIQVHVYPWGQAGLRALDILAEGGVAPGRVVICHSDVEFNLPYIRALLARGAFVEFDNFGKEFYIDRADRVGFTGGVFARDVERVQALKRLIEDGHERRLLVTNDLCLKQMLHRYGGWGFDHILTHIVPMILESGIPQSAVDRLIRENPADWLCPK